jgi:hypothetical protein
MTILTGLIVTINVKVLESFVRETDRVTKSSVDEKR